MAHWSLDSVVYHLFPLGCLGAPARNDFGAAPVDRLSALLGWIDYWCELGIDTLLLGPVFESSAHGYDVADHRRVDRRLGEDGALEALSRALHARGIRLVLDGVFHHTGRDFWAFRDVRERGEGSPYQDWYHLDFARRSQYGDPFAYQGWAGHYDLAKLDLRCGAVRDYLLSTADHWIDRYDIDGLRIDAADAVDMGFQRALAERCRARKPDFWLMGEVVHGDYGRWVREAGLTAVTNYEAYKGLWSSHNDRNYFEIAYSLEREFGERGIYRGLPLYDFADNHDVDRVASTLRNPAHLYPLYALLFTMPGVPSLYYGSEWGLGGRKGRGTDAPLRPALDPAAMRAGAPHPDLYPAIRRLIQLRRALPPLRHGGYAPLHVSHQQLAFARPHQGALVVVAVNAAAEPAGVPIHLPGRAGTLGDALNLGRAFELRGGRATIPVDPCWARVLVCP